MQAHVEQVSHVERRCPNDRDHFNGQVAQARSSTWVRQDGAAEADGARALGGSPRLGIVLASVLSVMETKNRIRIGNPLVKLGLVTGALFAIAASPGPGLHAGEHHDIAYVHGGVGKKSMEAVKQIDEDYDLKVVFVDAGNRYLSAVRVEIRHVNGDKALQLQTKGPVLLAKLPDGEYQLHANIPGRSKAKQTFSTRGDDRIRLTMRLPQK